MRLVRLIAAVFAVGLTGFIVATTLLYLEQDRLIFRPPSIVVTETENDYFEKTAITTSDGETLAALHHPAKTGETTILVFHGNAGAAVYQRPRGALLVEAGFGVLLAEYRGYPGSTGTPSQEGLFADARATYDFLKQDSSGPVALYGSSLGAAVAVQLATERAVSALVLEAPFDSMLAVAQRRYPWVPVAPLLKHAFRSDLQIAKVTAPILIMHGQKDNVVPLEHGKRLAGLAPQGTAFVEMSGAGHNDLATYGSIDRAIEFFKSAAASQFVPEKLSPAAKPDS